MNNVLDCRFNGNISKKNSIKFKKICLENITEFNDLIEQSFSNNNKSSFFYLTPSFSRNTLNSPIFHYFITAKFIEKYKNDILKYNTIFVDNYIHKDYIKFHLIKNNIKKKYIYKVKDNLFTLIIKIIFLNFLQCIKEIINRTIIFLISRLTLFFFKKIKLIGQIILIDRYVFPKYVSTDRYYNNLDKYIKKNQNIKFVPTLEYFNLSNFYDTYKTLRLSKNYIIKDDYITLTDLFKCYFKCLSLFKINILKIENYKIDYLIKLDILKLSNYIHPLIEGQITLLFIKNLKKEDINITTTINWYENNIKDKCWNIGFKDNFKKVKTKGYLGFFPYHLFLNISSPSKYEEKLNILPSTICVIGDKIIDIISKELKVTKIETAPAFRFFYLFNIKLKQDLSYNRKSVLISLPILKHESDKIFQDVYKICNEFPNIRFYLMPHPTNIIYSKKYILKKNIIFVENNVSKYLKKSNIVLSSMSSICIEAISLKKPLILLNNLKTIDVSIINKDIDKRLYKRYTNYKGLKKILRYLIEKKLPKEVEIIADDYFKGYFEEIDEMKSQNFLLN